MSRHSKQRRDAKRRRQRFDRRGERSQRPPWTGPPRSDQRPPPDARQLLDAALWAVTTGSPGQGAALDAVVEAGAPAVTEVEQRLRTAVADLWGRGWTPTDVVRFTERRLSRAHADLAAQLAVCDAREREMRGQALHARWREQLDEVAGRQAAAGALRSDVGLRTAVVLLSSLRQLPALPQTIPAPGEEVADALAEAGHLDQRMLAKVRALLAKAESTDFEQEAESLTAKAQELIARHAIADVLLHSPGDVGKPSTRRVPVDDPYADAKAGLVSSVAAANRCRAVHSIDCGWVTLFGYDRDLDAVELLTASLLTQATGAMARHGSTRDALGRSTTRSFRRAFLYGFAQRIGQRLQEATDAEVATAATADGERLLPVLAARDDQLGAAIEEAFPRLVKKSASVSNAAGWGAGRAAADVAQLGTASGALDRSRR